MGILASCDNDGIQAFCDQIHRNPAHAATCDHMDRFVYMRLTQPF